MALNIQIQKLQEEIFEELERPSSISPSFIGNYVITNAGTLNNLIGTSFSGVCGSGLTPPMQEDELAISKLMFENYWIKRQIKGNLGANAYTDWVTIKEGDSQITKPAKSDTAKNFQVLQKENRIELQFAISAYRIKRSIPAEASTPISGSWSEIIYYP